MRWRVGTCIVSALVLACSAVAEKAEPAPKSTYTVERAEAFRSGVAISRTATPQSTEKVARADRVGAAAGGDTCASATVIGSLPYTDSGDTSLFALDDYNEVCPFTNTGAPDVVYSYTPAADEIIDISLCNSLYDTKLYVYEGACQAPNSGLAVACNDDACGSDGFKSEITGLSVTAGTTYFIIVDGYDGASSGTYTIDVSVGLPPYEPECPADSFFSQVLDGPNDAWTFGPSESGLAIRYDDITGNTGTIEQITFFGLELFNDPFFGFTPCTETTPEFEITFYADAGGAPGAIVCQEVVLATRTVIPAGDYAGFTLNQYDVALTNPCGIGDGWISIVGLGDTGCWFYWGSSGGAGGGSSLLDALDGSPLVVEDFNLNYCFRGAGAPLEGACCDPVSGTCVDNVPASQCAPGSRFVANTLCADLDPLCGQGACCFDDGTPCFTGTEADCTTQGGLWLGDGTDCSQCPFVVACPPGATLEGEPVCADGYVDNTNGGCNSDPAVFGAIACGETICGTGGNYVPDPNDPNVIFRDTDWYAYDVVAGEEELSITLDTEFNASVLLIDLGPGCAGATVIDSITVNAETSGTLTACLPVGSYAIFVAAADLSAVCGDAYVLSLNCQPCVLPRGACCLTDGSCVDGLLEGECDAQGGTYQGDGTDCSTVSCPQPLANDNCDTAEVITTPYFSSFDTSGALTGTPSGSCNSSSAIGAGTTDNDVWFEWTPTEDCLATLTVDPNTYDGLATIYTGVDCNSLVEFQCSEAPEPIVIQWTAIAGTTYWIQVGDWGTFPGGGLTTVELTCSPLGVTGACCLPSGACVETDILDCGAQGGTYQGDGTLCADTSCPQPVEGDNCGLPIQVTLDPNSTYVDPNQTTCGRVDDYETTCMGLYDGGEDIIYELIVTEAACYQVTVDADTIWAGVAIFDICPAFGDPNCLGQATTSSNPDTFQIDLAPGTYYLMVDTFPAPECADFTLTIEPCPPPAPGETCEDANLIPSVPFSTSFDNNNSTADGPAGACNSSSAVVMQNDIWFEWTPDQDCIAELTVDPTSYDGIVVVYEGTDCNNLVELDCGDEPEPIVLTWNAVGGTTYFIQVGDWGTAEGGGITDFSLRCVLCGDLDFDLDVDGDDYNLFIAAYGSQTGDANYNADADYDGDGVVSLADFQTWVGCYRDFVTPALGDGNNADIQRDSATTGGQMDQSGSGSSIQGAATGSNRLRR
jgi:hypothetical protein